MLLGLFAKIKCKNKGKEKKKMAITATTPKQEQQERKSLPEKTDVSRVCHLPWGPGGDTKAGLCTDN